MKPIFTADGLALVKTNGKVIDTSLKANEKALDEGKWYLSGKAEDGKPRKRSSYVQYLRGYQQALKDLVDGKELKPWVPQERPVAAATNLPQDIEAIVNAAVKAALKAQGK